MPLDSSTNPWRNHNPTASEEITCFKAQGIRTLFQTYVQDMLSCTYVIAFLNEPLVLASLITTKPFDHVGTAAICIYHPQRARTVYIWQYWYGRGGVFSFSFFSSSNLQTSDFENWKVSERGVVVNDSALPRVTSYFFDRHLSYCIAPSLRHFHLSRKKKKCCAVQQRELRRVGDTVVSKHGCNSILRTGEGGFMNQPLKNSSSNLNIGVIGGYGSPSMPAERKML